MLSEKQTKDNTKRNNKILVANLFLVLTLLISGVVYISFSNKLASQKYRLQILKNQMAKANDSYEALSSQISGQYDIKTLTSVAEGLGMKEDKNMAAMIDSGGEVLLSKLSNQ